MKILKRLTAAFTGTLTAASLVTSVLPVNMSVTAAETEENFAKALQYSMYFYDANMCGTQVDENTRLSWRGDCHTYDAQVPLKPMGEDNIGTNLSEEFIEKYKKVLDPDGDGCVDVAGGMHDAGDHVEFGMPENYSAATLGWGYYEFRDSYKNIGEDGHIETILRYFNDYLMKCTFRDKSGKVIAHCYQVGDGDIDHAIWEAPEIDSMARPAFFLTAEKPQTDYVVSAAASLAINYLNFKNTDKRYAEKCLDYAEALWNFANENELELSDNADGPKMYYQSNKWEDDYVWCAAWLYRCTGDVSFLEAAMPYVDYYAPSGWCYCWNDMWSGAACVLGAIDLEHPELDIQNMYREAQGKTQYEAADHWIQVEKAINKWQGMETEGGYAFLDQWGSCRYNAAMQLICLVYDKYKNNDKPSEYSLWAKKQMEYIMGNNPLDRCYIVGFKENSAKYPHHRAASGLLSSKDTREQRHVLWGALVGGPDGLDNHIDITDDYIYNEVTIDYNAAFVGACAGLYKYFGTEDMKPEADFPPEEEESAEEGGGNGYWVEAFGVDDIKSDGSGGVTKVSFKVMTDSTSPSDKVSVKYYFNVKEMQGGINSVTEVKELYDQSYMEVEGADGIISGPFQYKSDPNIYYVEISWNGYKIANSGKKYQFDVGLYYGDTWDPKNDWSYDGLKICTDTDMFGDGNEEKIDNICVYSEGVLVGGTEPDGTVPALSGGKGDVNKDLKVNAADAVALSKFLVKKSKKLADSEAADMDSNEKLNVFDLAILKRVLIKK